MPLLDEGLGGFEDGGYSVEVLLLHLLAALIAEKRLGLIASAVFFIAVVYHFFVLSFLVFPSAGAVWHLVLESEVVLFVCAKVHLFIFYLNNEL